MRTLEALPPEFQPKLKSALERHPVAERLVMLQLACHVSPGPDRHGIVDTLESIGSLSQEKRMHLLCIYQGLRFSPNSWWRSRVFRVLVYRSEVDLEALRACFDPQRSSLPGFPIPAVSESETFDLLCELAAINPPLREIARRAALLVGIGAPQAHDNTGGAFYAKETLRILGGAGTDASWVARYTIKLLSSGSFGTAHDRLEVVKAIASFDENDRKDFANAFAGKTPTLDELLNWTRAAISLRLTRILLESAFEDSAEG